MTARPGVPRVLALAASLAMMLSSVPHGLLGWPALQGELEAAGVSAVLQQGLRIGWLFGSAAMVIMGLVGLLAARAMPRGNPLAWQVACVVGGAYAAFGVWALAASAGDPFFAVFIVPGMALALGAWSSR